MGFGRDGGVGGGQEKGGGGRGVRGWEEDERISR